MAIRRMVRGKQVSQNPHKGADLQGLVKEINKEFGAGSVMMASQKKQPIRLPTTIFTLDLALCGGIFMGCTNEFLGAKHSGKTTALLKCIASAQRAFPDKLPAMVDAEITFDPVWAAKLGVDLDRLLIHQPESGEEAVDAAQAFMEHPGVSLVAMDSIAALIPMKVVEDSSGDAHVGIHAKLVTRLMGKVNASLAKASKAGLVKGFLCTNQQRAGIGKWAPPGQEAISNPGGKALEHFTALQVKFKNKETLKKDEEGFDMLSVNEHAFSIEKNKFNAGIRKGEFQLQRIPDEEIGLAEGDIDDAGSMLAFAKKMGIYTGGGRSWTLELPEFSDTMGSADEWIRYLYSDLEVHQQLRNHLIVLHATKLGMPDYALDLLYAHT